MANECCKLVGNLLVENTEGIISLSTKSSTEISKIEDVLIVGQTVGTVSVTAYASSLLHTGCAGRLGVSLPWIRKYDCEKDETHFIYSGEGKSYFSGSESSLATVLEDSVEYAVLNGSASSGPTTLYEHDMQHDGYGLVYTGNPWTFDTRDSDTLKMALNVIEYANPLNDQDLTIYTNLYLQSFSLQLAPNTLPTVNFDFAFSVSMYEDPIV